MTLTYSKAISRRVQIVELLIHGLSLAMTFLFQLLLRPWRTAVSSITGSLVIFVHSFDLLEAEPTVIIHGLFLRMELYGLMLVDVVVLSGLGLG